MIQSGDILLGDGRGGESIYGRKFEDENFAVKHSEAGLLSMVNGCKNSNNSQFLITLAPTPWLDGKHVVFGRVVEGMEVVRAIEEKGTRAGTPQCVCVIADCGELVRENGGQSSQ
jgi:peptidylprolyl isomerase